MRTCVSERISLIGSYVCIQKQARRDTNAIHAGRVMGLPHNGPPRIDYLALIGELR